MVRKITLVLCLCLTACTVGITRIEVLTPAVSIIQTPPPALAATLTPTYFPISTYTFAPVPLPTPVPTIASMPLSTSSGGHSIEPLINHQGGTETAAVFAQGNYAYVIYKNYQQGFSSAREELATLDISDPARPVQIGFQVSLGAESVYISDDYIYVATSRNCELPDGSCEVGLRVHSFDPESPIVRSDYNWLQGETQSGMSFEIAGGDRIVYVATSLGGVAVMDVSDPDAPVQASFLEGHACAVAAAGKYVYVLETVDWNEWYVRVLDVSIPTAPVDVGNSQTFEWLKRGADPNMIVAGNYIYVADWFGLHVMDISDPTVPTKVGFYATSELARDGAELEVANGYAYLAGVLGGLWVLDVSNPTNPSEVAFYDLQAVVWDVSVAGNYIYVACPMLGLQVLRHVKPGL